MPPSVPSPDRAVDGSAPQAGMPGAPLRAPTTASSTPGNGAPTGGSQPWLAALPMRDGAPVDPLVPLTMLEAVRALDLPEHDLDTELVHELRNKRLGLSETVYLQIRRYGDAVKRGQRVPFEEAHALMRLVGRRPDADLCFREAGRRLARRALGDGAGPSRLLPRAVARPLALRRVRALAERYLQGRVERQGSTVVLDVPSPVTADAGPGSVGCGHTDAALREFLLALTGQDAAVDHVACVSRGDGACQWRTDWRR